MQNLIRSKDNGEKEKVQQQKVQSKNLKPFKSIFACFSAKFVCVFSGVFGQSMIIIAFIAPLSNFCEGAPGISWKLAGSKYRK